MLDGARPGQRWPAAREVAALVLGGLRVRAGASTHGSPAHGSPAWLSVPPVRL